MPQTEDTCSACPHRKPDGSLWIVESGHVSEIPRFCYLSELTVSFLRPLARRRDITARPSAVFMRVRNPCVLARLRLFG